MYLNENENGSSLRLSREPDAISEHFNESLLEHTIVNFISLDAEEFVKGLLLIYKKYSLLINMKYSRRFMFNYGFYFLKSKNLSNIFISVTQALLLELSKRFEGGNIEEINFRDILSEINKIDDDSFIYTIMVLTQIDSKLLIYVRNIGKFFLHYLRIELDEVTFVDKQSFYDKFFNIIKRVVEICINSIENIPNNPQRYINFNNIYNEISNNDLNKYISCIFSMYGENYSLSTQAKTFYYFANSNLELIVNGLDCYISNSLSYYQKIKIFFNRFKIDDSVIIPVTHIFININKHANNIFKLFINNLSFLKNNKITNSMIKISRKTHKELKLYYNIFHNQSTREWKTSRETFFEIFSNIKIYLNDKYYFITKTLSDILYIIEKNDLNIKFCINKYIFINLHKIITNIYYIIEETIKKSLDKTKLYSNQARSYLIKYKKFLE